MTPKYEPKTTDRKLGWLVEECGEVLAAVGKTQRWGLSSVDPTPAARIINQGTPAEHRETNREWILRELDDLISAAFMVRADLLGSSK